MEDIIKFHRIFPAAIPPMGADESALGTLPTAAYQYCEAIRTASSFGWYVFPPTDIRLAWDGAETLYEAEGEWLPLTSVHLDGGFLELWDTHAPADLKGRAPPYLSSLFVPGIVQIWSGFLVSSERDWSVLVRLPANILQSHAFACHDGHRDGSLQTLPAVHQYPPPFVGPRNRHSQDEAALPGAAHTTRMLFRCDA